MTLAAVTIAGCLAIGAGSDQILLRNLEPAFSTLEGAVPDTVIALAPALGVTRRFDIGELQRIATRLHLPAPEREVCFVRPAAPLDAARVLEALRAAAPDARIELLDFSRYPVPEGALEFSLQSLRPGPAGGFWSGSIRYGGAHRVAVWARVAIRVASRRIVATRDLKPALPIDAEALRVETRDEFPSADAQPSRIEEVVGLVPRRPIRAGETLRADWLDAAKAVTRGETVDVEVREGGALLHLPGQALASGEIGQTIPILNPDSNRRFPARIEAKGKVGVGKASR